MSVPIKALQAIILRVQERRDGAGQVTSGDDDSSGIVDFTCESLLGVAGRNSGLMTIPVAYTPTNPDGTESMSLETCPLVYILPAATVLSRRPLVERFCQLLLLLLFNKKCTHAELIAADVQLRTAGNSRAVCSTSSNKNLIRDLFCNIVDENMSRDVDVLDSHRPFSDSTMVYNFRSLATYLAKELVTSETATLLVYCMLQYNSTFLYSLMSSKGWFNGNFWCLRLLFTCVFNVLLGDFGGLLMISLLHRMYNQEEILRAHDTNMTEHIQSHKLANKMRKKMKSGRFHLMTTFGVTLEPLYVTVINTLILSQDRNFARYMFTLPQSNASASSAAPFVGVKMRSNVKDESWRTFDNVCWYKERNLSADVSLGDIAILCVLRTALLALFRQKNKYLLSNCLAILSNLGPHVINIHAYTAERVVTIIEKLGKRIIETEIKYMKRSRPKTEVTPPAASPNKKGQQTDLFRSSLDNSNEPLSASGIASYIEIMQNMQDTLRVVLVLVCRAIRPSRQIDNVQLIYALIRGGTKVCSIVEEPMIMDIAEGSSVDVHGLAHMAPFVDDGKDGKKSDGKGMKRFVNKIGSILSSVVKNRKRDAILPPVDAASPQLPIVYVPLLVKKGIKWMERRTNKASTMSAASSPQKNSSKNVGNVNTSPMVPAETTVGVRAVEANDEDCENNGGVHKSAQEVSIMNLILNHS